MRPGGHGRRLSFDLAGDLAGNQVALGGSCGKKIMPGFWATWFGVLLPGDASVAHGAQGARDQGFEILAVDVLSPRGAHQRGVRRQDVTSGGPAWKSSSALDVDRVCSAAHAREAVSSPLAALWPPNVGRTILSRVAVHHQDIV